MAFASIWSGCWWVRRRSGCCQLRRYHRPPAGSDRADEVPEPRGQLGVFVIDRYVDDRGARVRERLRQDRPERARRVDSIPLRAEGGGQSHEVRVTELDARFPPQVRLLLPLYQVVSAVAEDHVDDAEPESARGLELLAVHEEAAVTAHRHHLRSEEHTSELQSRGHLVC